MMMVSDDCLVECKIDDSDEEQISTPPPPPPPEFASKASTPTPKPPTPPAEPTPSTPSTPPCPINRDPFGINKHLKVEVSDVLAEPTTPYSMDGVWIYSLVGFEKTRIWTYRCLSLLFAVPLAFLCGFILALLACLRVWFLVPCVQLSNTFLPCLRSVFICAVNVFVAPFCMSLALCCSQISILLSNKDFIHKREKDTV
ncbi:caveolin-2 [Nothobranchius furzeri]|uniref:Caveolin n=3 Tax=Nothobranchius TaxID=28779 RepID=A0A1A8AZ44_NOTFU|nr:caveolin-2 [Nothobranchius furzeri]XP_015824116.1 caveolin-2 [Nothobranchius furzeri]KAF7210369.1 transcript variant X2 [Nothobranchius furzeri]KAF7210370.1 transcript variant X1 [Nothobranchius furzeri]